MSVVIGICTCMYIGLYIVMYVSVILVVLCIVIAEMHAAAG